MNRKKYNRRLNELIFLLQNNSEIKDFANVNFTMGHGVEKTLEMYKNLPPTEDNYEKLKNLLTKIKRMRNINVKADMIEENALLSVVSLNLYGSVAFEYSNSKLLDRYKKEGYLNINPEIINSIFVKGKSYFNSKKIKITLANESSLDFPFKDTFVLLNKVSYEDQRVIVSASYNFNSMFEDIKEEFLIYKKQAVNGNVKYIRININKYTQTENKIINDLLFDIIKNIICLDKSNTTLSLMQNDDLISFLEKLKIKVGRKTLNFNTYINYYNKYVFNEKQIPDDLESLKELKNKLSYGDEDKRYVKNLIKLNKRMFHLKK